MLSWGFGLLIVGIIMIVIEFVYALANMGKAVTGSRDFGNMFTSHLGAMMGMAIGSGLAVVGGILVAIALVQKFIL